MKKRFLNYEVAVSADEYVVMVPLKELQEAGLGAGGPLDPPETQVVVGSLHVAHVHHQVLQPETRPLSHRGQLGRPAGRGGKGRRKEICCMLLVPPQT